MNLFLFSFFFFSKFVFTGKCSKNWIVPKFHKRNLEEYNNSHLYNVSITLRAISDFEKNIHICGEVFSNEVYLSKVPAFRFVFFPGNVSSVDFFQSSKTITTEPIWNGHSFFFETMLKSTETFRFHDLPSEISIEIIDHSIWMKIKSFEMNVAFFSDYFEKKSLRIVSETYPINNICILLYGYSGHGKDCFSSSLSSLSSPTRSMLHPTGAGKGMHQTTNVSHVQFVVSDKVKVLQTVGFDKRNMTKCGDIESFVNRTILGDISCQSECKSFIAIYLLSTEEMTTEAIQSHECAVKFITSQINTVFDQVISTYTLFNMKGRTYSEDEQLLKYQELLFKPPELNTMFIDLNMDSLERDFEKDVLLADLLEDILDQHLVNYYQRKKIAMERLKNRNWLSREDMVMLNMGIKRYLLQLMWQNFSFLGVIRSFRFIIEIVIPFFVRTYIFGFLKLQYPILIDVLLGWINEVSSETLSIVVGYSGLGICIVLLYGVLKRCLCPTHNHMDSRFQILIEKQSSSFGRF